MIDALVAAAQSELDDWEIEFENAVRRSADIERTGVPLRETLGFTASIDVKLKRVRVETPRGESKHLGWGTRSRLALGTLLPPATRSSA